MEISNVGIKNQKVKREKGKANSECVKSKINKYIK